MNDSIPVGYCQCGCGEKTALATKTHRRSGHMKGQPVRFLVGHGSRIYGHPPRQPLQGLSPEQRFWKKVTKSEGCWEWSGALKDNGSGFHYGVFRTYSGPKDKSGKQHYAHRYSWELHFGAIPDGMVICHHCDNPPCVRPDHLFLGWPADNNRDMWEKGRGNTGRGISRNRGEDNPNSTLDAPLVRSIRRHYYTEHKSQKQIARLLDIQSGAVQSVVEGSTWGWLPNEDGSVFLPYSRSNSPRGERVNLAKLTEGQVREIRARYSQGGIGFQRLGNEYGVSKAAVMNVVHRKTWAHVLDD